MYHSTTTVPAFSMCRERCLTIPSIHFTHCQLTVHVCGSQQGMGDRNFIIPIRQTFEPAHEIMTLFVLRKLILQMRMRSHPMGLDV